MGKFIRDIVKTDTLSLSECSDGFWLYDKTRCMNLAMRDSSEREAFLSALGYYQDRLKTVESMYSELKCKVDSFVSQFEDED